YCFLQMSDLERELEQELHRVLDPITALPIPARRQPEARRAARALLGGAGAALTVKALTGVAVAAAAVTVAGAATTGSLNPAAWRIEGCDPEGPGLFEQLIPPREVLRGTRLLPRRKQLGGAGGQGSLRRRPAQVEAEHPVP